jgi:hypothetical protein
MRTSSNGDEFGNWGFYNKIGEQIKPKIGESGEVGNKRNPKSVHTSL